MSGLAPPFPQMPRVAVKEHASSLLANPLKTSGLQEAERPWQRGTRPYSDIPENWQLSGLTNALSSA